MESVSTLDRISDYIDRASEYFDRNIEYLVRISFSEFLDIIRKYEFYLEGVIYVYQYTCTMCKTKSIGKLQNVLHYMLSVL
jgi:hypothetical protein